VSKPAPRGRCPAPNASHPIVHCARKQRGGYPAGQVAELRLRSGDAGFARAYFSTVIVSIIRQQGGTNRQPDDDARAMAELRMSSPALVDKTRILETAFPPSTYI
jgi:hypothetical protein